METNRRSPSGDYPSATDAAEQLKLHEAIRDRSDRQGPSRTFAFLNLWSAIVLAVYVGVFLWANGSHSADQAGAGPYTIVFLFPVLIFSSLISGARERFSVRTTRSPGYWVAYAVVTGGFITLGALGIAGVGYPWWLNLLEAATMFAVGAAEPFRQLRTAASSDRQRWTNERLEAPARLTTVLIGVAGGLLAAASSQRVVFSAASIGIMVVLIVVLISWRARWGLPRAGYEWGPIHWAAFGFTMSILFGLGVVLSRTDWVTVPLGIAAGAVIVATMLAAALLPPSSRPR